jgi:hypothetical protein
VLPVASSFLSIGDRFRAFLPVNGLQVVERSSAILGLPNEIPLPIDADHREICRFSNPKDPRYMSIIFAVVDLIKDARIVEGTLLHTLILVLYSKLIVRLRFRTSRLVARPAFEYNPKVPF